MPKLMEVEAPPKTVRPFWPIGLAAVVVLAALAAGVWYLAKPSPPPRVAEYTQITHNGHIGGLAGSDGSRLFFNIYPWGPVGQVGITGGDIATISAGPNSPFATDVSSDGASLLLWSSTGIFAMGTAGGPPRFITKRTGAYYPAWSPDATSIAYTEDDNLHSMKIDGTRDQKLATGEGAISDIAWSPDGNRIRFTRNSVLWEISAAGGDLHPVFPSWQGPKGQCCGRWTRDGDFYLFLAGGNNENGPNVGGSEQIWARDERHGLFGQVSSPPYPLTSGPIHWGTPIPSRDATKILAVGTTPRAELARFDAKSKRIEPYLGGIPAEFLAFSVTEARSPMSLIPMASCGGRKRMEASGCNSQALRSAPPSAAGRPTERRFFLQPNEILTSPSFTPFRAKAEPLDNSSPWRMARAGKTAIGLPMVTKSCLRSLIRRHPWKFSMSPAAK